MKAIQIEAFGNPAEVLKLVEIPVRPAAGEVVIAVEAPLINQYDLLMIASGYGYRPRLPAIMGTEGACCVVAVGEGVKLLKEGDRTLVSFLHPACAASSRWRSAGDSRLVDSRPSLRLIDISRRQGLGQGASVLVSEDSSYVTGIELFVDGGFAQV